MKKHSKNNGYFKYYNKEGKSCRIKFDNDFKFIEEKKKFNIIIKFKKDDETLWNYHSPFRKFKSIFEIINYILKNLENDKMVFKISKSKI